MTKLYLDLDGVMADFDTFFTTEFGIDSDKLDDNVMWKWINGHGNFFRNMPVCIGAVEFFEAVKHLNPVILTACPKTNYTVAATQKRQWVYEHLSKDVTVIPMLGGKNKAMFMHSPGDVLIDDFEKNCIPWREHGGVAIQHKDFATTWDSIKHIFNLEIYNV